MNNLQQLIDSLFAALEAAEPSLAFELAALQGIIDEVGIPALSALLAGLGITSATTPQQLLDGIFTALQTKLAGHPVMLFIVTGLKTTIDAALSKLTVAPKGFSSL